MFSGKFTGMKADQPKFKEVLSLLQEGDTLVVTKLDCFARSTVDANQTVRGLFDKGVKVRILNMGQVKNIPTSKLVFNVMSAFAELERDMIVERT